jgi:hypothetical protein
VAWLVLTSNARAADESFDPQVLLLLIIAVYFIPAIVASTRRHRNRFAIGVLNLLGGWTLIGWVVAMVWACTSDVEPKQQDTTRWSRSNKGNQVDPDWVKRMSAGTSVTPRSAGPSSDQPPSVANSSAAPNKAMRIFFPAIALLFVVGVVLLVIYVSQTAAMWWLAR